MDFSHLIDNSKSGQNEWAERCEYWQRKSEIKPKKRKRREKETQPLILTGHGISITVHRGTLLIRDGNTHYPAEPRNFRFFKGELSIPPRIVLVDGSGNVTLDALDWLAEQSVDLIRLNYDGRIKSISSASGYSADKKKVNWQIETRNNNAKRMAFAIPLIKEKIRETLINLNEFLPPSNSREKAIETALSALNELNKKPPKDISKLLFIEGRVAAGYFFAWRHLEIKWTALNRYPIPNEWNRFFSRSALKAGEFIRNQGATHPINAMLNYAYGVLEAKIRIKSIADGYDPSIGIMHDRASPERHSLVYDLMEPKRPVVDRVVLKLIAEEVFSGADYVIRDDGVCRLNTVLAKVLTQTFDVPDA